MNAGSSKRTRTDHIDEIRSKIRSQTREHPANWDVINSQDLGKSTRLRDVYENQQLKRSELPQAQTPFTRQVISVVIGVVLFVTAYVFCAIGKQYAYAAQALGDITLMMAGPAVAYGLRPALWQLVVSLICGVVPGAAFYAWSMQNLKAQNALADFSDINSYEDDQHIALPEEVARFYDWFPDNAAHSTVNPSTLIGHMALENKGIRPVRVLERHCEGEDDTEFYAAIDNDVAGLDIQTKPMFDTKFSDDLFESSGVDERYRRRFDTRKIPYNPGNRNRDKLRDFDTVADLINGDWTIPWYETGRPSGAYLVDTAPVNSLVIAITRAGKGQTIIEPTIDMWLRSNVKQNIVVNDPKGELLLRFYVPAVVRGFRPVQFNLINALKTDIENPLMLAAMSARDGDSTKVAAYIKNIGDVFFPTDAAGQQDPMWNNAANNAFTRAADGLIEFTLEEERALRAHAAREGWDVGHTETEVDRLWGHVTLYNCYQMFVQMTSKKLKNPAVAFNKQAKDGKFDKLSEDEYQAKLDQVNALAKLWNNATDVDLLTLYFNATAALPRNSMRELVGNADNALRAMGGADKMIASVYAIALTAMSFFSDPTISTLTSGTPSQNVDLSSFSFPRCIGVRLHPDYLKRYHLVGMQARWTAYSDPEFKHQYEGKDFTHDDTVGREGWARFYLKGIFPEMRAWLKLDIRNPATGVIIRTLWFEFEKTYQLSLDGRHYVKDPVLDEKIIHGGILRELVEVPQHGGGVRYIEQPQRFPSTRVVIGDDGSVRPQRVEVDAVRATRVRWDEKPKILFMVTPPHLMGYAKLILIILKQLVDLNFDQSYMTNSNQKPDFATRFMIDELGNLQSEGHGINGLETMLSIGLGQSQYFTLILQTLQQLTKVYGSDSDKIIQGNAQPLSSKVATPDGWRHMGDIQVGDKVLTPKGRVSQVTGVYPRGRRKVYKVTCSDGSTCLCCNQHLWAVKVSE